MPAGIAGRIEPVPGVWGKGIGAGRTGVGSGGREGGLMTPEFQGATLAVLSFFPALSYGSLDDERCFRMEGGLIVGAGLGTGTGSRAIAPAPGGGGGGGCGG